MNTLNQVEKPMNVLGNVCFDMENIIVNEKSDSENPKKNMGMKKINTRHNILTLAQMPLMSM